MSRKNSLSGFSCTFLLWGRVRRPPSRAGSLEDLFRELRIEGGVLGDALLQALPQGRPREFLETVSVLPVLLERGLIQRQHVYLAESV